MCYLSVCVKIILVPKITKEVLKLKLRRKVLLYEIVIVLLVTGFVVFVIASDKNYNDLLSVNDDLLEQIDTNKESYDNIIKKWEDSYHSLESDYGKCLVENDKLKEEMKKVELPVYSYSEVEIKLLAVCVQCEAGEENEEAQKYITGVILNRVKSSQFKDTIEEVIYEKVNGCPQFSVAYNGMMDDCTLSPTVLANVYSVIVSGSDLPENVLYFYSASLKEDNWVKTLNTYDIVEGTVFAYE